MAEKEQFFLAGDNAISAYASEISDTDLMEPIPRGRATAFRSIANTGRTFVGHDTNISVRSEYGRQDYDYFRPGEQIPTNQMEVISMCMKAYYRVGIIHNIINVMAEFAAHGIRFQHPRKSTENFYNRWFIDKVCGKEVTCQFLVNLIRDGNVIVKKSMASVPVVDEKSWRKAMSADLDMKDMHKKFVRREIPMRFTFISPLSVEVIGGELSNFIGSPSLALKIPPSIRNAIARIDSVANPGQKLALQKLIKSIPKDILSAMRSGANIVPLDMDKVSVYHYRKDSWKTWGSPITESVLNDIITLEKMKLADISALDGAISNIRLWRVGVLDGVNSILPTKAVINKLRNILANNVGGGVLDLVWGPELDFKESNSMVWRFLGSEKYEATLNQIYDGYGIPPTLRSGGSNSNTGNVVALNTLIKRIMHIRHVLIHFWRETVEYVHNAMGFKGNPPRIIFDNMVLADEAAEKQLLLNLWDRDLISTESIQEIFGRIPEIERARINDESELRKEEDGVPVKASPFHNPDKKHELKKIALQAGDVTPSEVGLELDERKDGQEAKTDKMNKMQLELKKIDVKNRPRVSTTNKTGTPGRPNNITETKKRKPKPKEKPSIKADFTNMLIWGDSVQKHINKVATPVLLKAFEKENLRQLNKDEISMMEYIKFGILSSFEPFSDVSDSSIYAAIQSCIKPHETILHNYKVLLSDYHDRYGAEPKMEENRRIFISAYANSFSV